MKRFLCILLLFALLLPVTACTDKNIERPISYYYLRRTNSFGTPDSMIAPEIVEGALFSHIAPMLRSYLMGPRDLTLSSPFPKGTYLMNVDIGTDTISITLTDSFASLTGIELTLACCALAKTVTEFSGIDTVQIQTASELLDGDTSIIIHAGDIILYDDYSIDATEGTE